jgi:hypothetical protein
MEGLARTLPPGERMGDETDGAERIMGGADERIEGEAEICGTEEIRGDGMECDIVGAECENDGSRGNGGARSNTLDETCGDAIERDCDGAEMDGVDRSNTLGADACGGDEAGISSKMLARGANAGGARETKASLGAGDESRGVAIIRGGAAPAATAALGVASVLARPKPLSSARGRGAVPPGTPNALGGGPFMTPGCAIIRSPFTVGLAGMRETVGSARTYGRELASIGTAAGPVTTREPTPGANTSPCGQ